MVFPLWLVSRLRFADYTLLLVFEVALGTTSLLKPYLAKTLLGWRPSKQGLVDGIPIYYAIWNAAQQLVMSYTAYKQSG